MIENCCLIQAAFQENVGRQVSASVGHVCSASVGHVVPGVVVCLL